MVHAFGLAADVDAFLALGVPVVEDCAQALGAEAGGRPVGARGAAAVGSFYATKLLTTGEGGAVAGPAGRVARARDARDYDEREDLRPRFNYKMTDLQAALGRAQLRRLDAFLARRRAIAARYRAALDRPLAPVLDRLERRGVAARRPVFRPIHRALGLDGYPEAERLWARCLSLPCYPRLSDAEVDAVAAALAEALGA